MEVEALEIFGQVLMTRVRDAAITDWDMILDGRMVSPHAVRVRKMLESMSPEQLIAVDRIVPQIVDTTLHHLLWTLEQEERVDIAVETDTGMVGRLCEMSDGLAGEQFGWIPRYSKQRYEPLD